ncbi:MAG: lysine N(6)-hydroxylase/L-ornithine N(5)-oxygenase family protein [Planctomycetes bacterium]|nr:lysine N(6)-hydroxylase/L-ornithine N(5)-oxygenase family protein [Planctomycetota bacterium]
MLDWLVIGGGVHGTYFSHVLTGPCGFERDRVRVLDRNVEPLQEWFRRSRATCMDFLRSPGVHHIDVEPFSLLQFSRGPTSPPSGELFGMYKLPSVCLFEAHARATIQRRRSNELRLRGEASGVEKLRSGWRVETSEGALEARHILLALGPPARANWPEWARTARSGGAQLDHVFELDQRPAPCTSGGTLVVGSGCTAAHLVLALAREASGPVTWACGEPLRHAEYDSDPGWLGPKYLRGFGDIPSSEQRREWIRDARKPGTIPARLLHPLQGALHRGRIQLAVGAVKSARALEGGRVQVSGPKGLPDNGFDRVLLATGFERRRPGGDWLQRTERNLGLPLAPCGFPQLTPTLEWGRNLLVAGELAELEVGPAARNIGGARLVAERLVRHWRAA